jgi:3-methyladenine DNA glycosylase AlkD
MNLAEAMRELESLGTAQNRKVYARHGVSAPAFGVSFADLNTLRKKLKVDHALAEQLWATGNHDARVLATMIADPRQLTAAKLRAWSRSLSDYVCTDAFSKLAAQSPAARESMDEWADAPGEWIAAVGWNLVAMTVDPPGGATDAELKRRLATIEAEIHDRPNRVRYAMNNALIAIGARPSLRAAAIAAARRIGTVEVDHGETGCKTPDAVAYIEKMASYRAAEAERAGARGKAPAKARGAAAAKRTPARKAAGARAGGRSAAR